MKSFKSLINLVPLLAVLFIVPSMAHADDGPMCPMSKCPMMLGGHCPIMMSGNYDKDAKMKDDSDKLFQKMHKLIKYQEKYNLSDNQLNQIKDLKVATKKNVIMRKAEIDVAALEIKSLLYDKDDINTQQINNLIDKKYDLKKEKAKTLVSAYAKLMDILTDEQKNMLFDKKMKNSEKK